MSEGVTALSWGAFAFARACAAPVELFAAALSLVGGAYLFGYPHCEDG
jgi:hypothetical protein